MSQPVKQQLDMIQSMLERGYGFKMSPHTLYLWGGIIGLETLFINYYHYFSTPETHNVANIVSVVSLALVFLLGFMIDHYLTKRWKEASNEVIPLVQKQVIRFLVFSLFVALGFQVTISMLGGYLYASILYVFVISFILFVFGLFSNSWYCWASVTIAILNIVLFSFEPPLLVELWFIHCVLIIGFPLIQFLTSIQYTVSRYIGACLVLSVSILVTTYAAVGLHDFFLKSPGELPVYSLHDKKPSGKFILHFPEGTELIGTLSTDRYEIKPVNMPHVTVRIKKNMDFVFDGKEYKNLFKVEGMQWENRDPFQLSRRLSYVHIITQDKLQFDFFLPYFTGKQCDCIELVE